MHGIDSVFLELPWTNHAFDIVKNGLGRQLIFQYMSQFLVWALTKRTIDEIEQLVEEQNLKDVFSKEKLRLLTEIKKGKSNEDLKQIFINIAELSTKYQSGKKL